MVTSRCYISLFLIIALGMMSHFAKAQNAAPVRDWAKGTFMDPLEPKKPIIDPGTGIDSSGTTDSAQQTGIYMPGEHVLLLEVYPNPATDKIFVRSEMHHDIKCVLIDPAGKQVNSFNINEWHTVSGLPKGTYFIVPETRTIKPVKVLIT